MTKIKQMLCALLTVCLLLIGSTNAMAAQPDTPSISVSANASIEVAPDTALDDNVNTNAISADTAIILFFIFSS